MNILFLIFGIIETILVVIFAYNNGANILNLNFAHISISSNFFIICISIYILGIVGGVLIMFSGLQSGFKKLGSAKRIIEKQSVSTDDYELKIRALENKVKTLEVALSKALNKDN